MGRITDLGRSREATIPPTQPSPAQGEGVKQVSPLLAKEESGEVNSYAANMIKIETRFSM